MYIVAGYTTRAGTVKTRLASFYLGSDLAIFLLCNTCGLIVFLVKFVCLTISNAFAFSKLILHLDIAC